MNATFHTGDVLRRHIGGNDLRPRYVRVGDTDGTGIAAGRIYVQDCDAAGFTLTGRGRYLLATSLASRYTLHHAATERSA